MKGNFIESNVLKMVEKIAKRNMTKNHKGPPICLGILHQPKRPKK